MKSKVEIGDIISATILVGISLTAIFFWYSVENITGAAWCCFFAGTVIHYEIYNLSGGNQIDEYNYLIKKLKDDNPERVAIFIRLRRDYKESMTFVAAIASLVFCIAALCASSLWDTVVIPFILLFFCGMTAGAFYTLFSQKIPEEDEEEEVSA